MKKIIAITGLKGSGKDTTADYIIKNYENWEKDSFDYGIYTSWDGSKELFFITLEEDKYYIYFLSSKDKYNLKDFPIEDGESLRTFKRIWL